MTWPKTLQLVKNGPANRSIVQRYLFSSTDRVSLLRLVFTKESADGSTVGKGHYVINIANRLGFEDKEAEADDEAMARHYLVCPFDVNSFTILVNSGKSIERYVTEAK